VDSLVLYLVKIFVLLLSFGLEEKVVFQHKNTIDHCRVVREKGPRFTRCDIFKITVQFFFNGAVKTNRGFSWGERLFF